MPATALQRQSRSRRPIDTTAVHRADMSPPQRGRLNTLAIVLSVPTRCYGGCRAGSVRAVVETRGRTELPYYLVSPFVGAELPIWSPPDFGITVSFKLVCGMLGLFSPTV